MDSFTIYGGKKLRGSISVRGAKNSALKIFAAALLCDTPVTVKNVPEVEDVFRMAELINKLGGRVERIKNGTYRISGEGLRDSRMNENISKRLRASIVLTAPLLVQRGEVLFPYPGGCVIGKRPIDVFLEGYQKFGATITQRKDLFRIQASRLRGARYFFSTMSVTGTETLLMAAVRARGITILENCACEPEIASLASFLNTCGADIQGAGTPTIRIKGVARLKGVHHTVIPDRIETGTFAILAAATNSKLTITHCLPEHIRSLLTLFDRMGIPYTQTASSLTIRERREPLQALDVKTHEYPGFPTDLQAPFCVLVTQTKGASLIHETIYEGRLAWTEDLARMGARIRMFDPHRVEIHGPTPLHGKEMKSPDLRAGMAFIIAALCAKGKSVINNVYQIDRGYEKIEKRLVAIGAQITRG